jgi:hypothetical protein
LGTSTNENGDYLLKIPTLQVLDSLKFSLIGYKNYTEKLSLADTLPKTIQLSNSSVLLEDIKVFSSAAGIVKSAFEHISTNFFTTPTMLTGFYREVSENPMKAQYNYLAEAVEEVYKPSYGSSANGDVHVIQSRKKEFIPLDSMETFFKSGLFVPHSLDIVYAKAAFINPKNAEEYQYTVQDVTEFDNQDVYIISFTPKDDTKAGYIGKLYISTKDEAFLGTDFTLNTPALEKSNKQAPKGVNFFNKEYRVRYQRLDAKYYLQSIWHTMALERKNKHDKIENIKLTIEFTTTDLEYQQVQKLKDVPKAHRSDVFLKGVGAMDEHFWGAYTTVLQSVALQEQLSKLSKSTFE